MVDKWAMRACFSFLGYSFDGCMTRFLQHIVPIDGLVDRQIRFFRCKRETSRPGRKERRRQDARFRVYIGKNVFDEALRTGFSEVIQNYTDIVLGTNHQLRQCAAKNASYIRFDRKGQDHVRNRWRCC